MRRELGHRLAGKGIALQREAAAGLGILILFLNILASTHSPSHFAGALSPDGTMAICSSSGQLFIGADGSVLPAAPSEPKHGQHGCICCVFMQASAVLPPPPPAPAPARNAAIQILRPGVAQHPDAAAAPTFRNRGPPSPSAAQPGSDRTGCDAAWE